MQHHISKKIFRMIRRILLVVAMPIVLYALLSMFEPTYLNGQIILMTITQSLPNFAIGLSMVFGMIVGIFDFSVGARVALSGVIGVYFSHIFGFWGFIFGCMIASLVLSLITGLMYSKLRIPSIIAGFASMLVYESLSVILVNNMTNSLDSSYIFLGSQPYIYIVMLIMFLFVWIIFNRTKFGYQIKAIGGNENVAKSMGINSPKLKLYTYLIGGIFLGIATIVSISSSGNVNPQQNMSSMSKVFTPMMGVMIGMTFASCDAVIGSFIGQLSITIVSTGLVALSIEHRLQNVIVGSALLVILIVQTNKYLFAEKLRIAKIRTT